MIEQDKLYGVGNTKQASTLLSMWSPLKNVKKKKNQEGFSENNRDSKADCK